MRLILATTASSLIEYYLAIIMVFKIKQVLLNKFKRNVCKLYINILLSSTLEILWLLILNT